MSYLLLILEPVGQRAERGAEGGREAYDSMLRFGERLRDKGQLVASQSLAGLDRAARVTVRQGQASRIDGPFAETKEMVGGFFLLDCADMAEAKAIAERCPAAAWATVEVRPVGPCFA